MVYGLIIYYVMVFDQKRILLIVNFELTLNQVIIVRLLENLILYLKIVRKKNHRRFVRNFGRNLKVHK
jgi:hypothetical protein